MSKIFWMNMVIMVCLLSFTAIYNIYNGWLYWLMIICVAGLGMYFVRETTDNQIKEQKK